MQFYVALIALGIGWNFGFIGATSLLATAHSREEQAKVQGINDLFVFGSVAAASFSSGGLLNLFGWEAVNQVIFPVVFVAGALLVWLAARREAAA